MALVGLRRRLRGAPAVGIGDAPLVRGQQAPERVEQGRRNQERGGQGQEYESFAHRCVSSAAPAIAPFWRVGPRLGGQV